MLILAIKKEKVSFRLYVDMAELVDEAELREMLLTLAEEEARHKVRFEMEYDKILPQKEEEKRCCQNENLRVAAVVLSK